MTPTTDAPRTAQDGPGRAIAPGVDVGTTPGAPAVSASPPARRVRPEREADELRAMMGRMIRALVRRAEAGDLYALEALSGLEAETSAAVALALRKAHDGPAAYSWGELGRELGITRQAAEKRASK